MFSGFKLLKAETPLPIWPGERERSTKIWWKDCTWKFLLKKIQLIPSLQPPPPIITTPPPPGKVHLLPDDHSQTTHLHHWLWCTTVFNKHLLKIILKGHSAIAAAVPEQEGLCFSAEFMSAHLKLYLGMGDLVFILKKRSWSNLLNIFSQLVKSMLCAGNELLFDTV